MPETLVHVRGEEQGENGRTWEEEVWNPDYGSLETEENKRGHGYWLPNWCLKKQKQHREIFSEYGWTKPILECNYTFPIDLTPNGINRKMPNQSKQI